MFLDLGSMLAYALVLIAVFFMAGVAAMFAVLHWVVRARARRAAREAGVPLTAPATRRTPAASATSSASVSSASATPSVPAEVPAQRGRSEWPGPAVRAAFARTPRPAARRG